MAQVIGVGLFASGGEDGVVCIWDLNRKLSTGQGDAVEGIKARQTLPHELLFQHAGHQAGVRPYRFDILRLYEESLISGVAKLARSQC